jgi:hypothetical protein
LPLGFGRDELPHVSHKDIRLIIRNGVVKRRTNAYAESNVSIRLHIH